MYLRRLQLANFKLLADQKLCFENPDGTPRMWTVLIGDNGLCKTSILQAIALAASGDKLARALVGDAQDFVRRTSPTRDTEITADFHTDGAGLPERLRIRLAVAVASHEFEGFEGARQLSRSRGRREPGAFAAGYGVGRRLARAGEVAVPQDPFVDRVKGLFDASHKMLGIEFAEAFPRPRRESDPNLKAAFQHTVDSVLGSKSEVGHRLLPGFRGVLTMGKEDGYTSAEMKRLRHPPTERMEVMLDLGGELMALQPALLSQGYQSMMAWVGDLIGQAMIERHEPMVAADLRGIVLIDEIDLHLHPTWQRQCIPILRKAFPRLQFVVTTHSPLVLTGFDQHEIVRLRLEDGLVVRQQLDFQSAALSANQLMTTFFDVPVAGRPAIERAQRRYLQLKARSDLTAVQRSELECLKQTLRPYLDSPLPGLSIATFQPEDVTARIDALEASLEAMDDEPAL